MAKKASAGLQDLIDRTGGPKLKATVTVNQPYAQDQHETLYYKHPRGGRAKYLEAPMFEEHGSWLEGFAKRLLVRGIEAPNEWAKVGRKLKGVVPKNAPVEFNDLRMSAGLEVKEGAQTVITEPPEQARLTDQEILAKDHMRNMGVGYR